MALGRAALRAGDSAKAVKYFSEALTVPGNLGEAKHLLANQSDIRYWLGCALAANGDATAIMDVPLPDPIKAILKGHYKSPPQDMGFIKTLREDGRVKTCPMCGSFKGGTLDHLMPQADFAAFAVFGLNLIPACDCNTMRSKTLTGPHPGERR